MGVNIRVNCEQQNSGIIGFLYFCHIGLHIMEAAYCAVSFRSKVHIFLKSPQH